MLEQEMLEQKLPKRMYDVFKEDITEFLERIREFYNKENFTFLNIHKAYNFLENIVEPLSKLSENSDEILKLLRVFNNLPFSVCYPIPQQELLKHADEVINLASNRTPVYDLLSSLANHGHKTHSEKNEDSRKYYLGFKNIEGMIQLAQYKKKVINLANELRNNDMAYEFEGDKGMFQNAEGVLKVADNKKEMLNLIKNMDEIGYDAKTHPCYLKADALGILVEKKETVIPFLKSLKNIGINIEYRWVLSDAKNVAEFSEKKEVTAFLNGFAQLPEETHHMYVDMMLFFKGSKEQLRVAGRNIPGRESLMLLAKYPEQIYQFVRLLRSHDIKVSLGDLVNNPQKALQLSKEISDADLTGRAGSFYQVAFKGK